MFFYFKQLVNVFDVHVIRFSLSPELAGLALARVSVSDVYSVTFAGSCKTMVPETS